MIDRIAPTRRPQSPSDGTQSWQSLLFCHWQVPIDALRRIVPASLEIDTFDGAAFVGTVPFKMRNIRPKWLPKALAFNFLETNVRTYVVHNGKPGVYFFSLDASSRLAVWAARTGWALPYYYAKMSATPIAPDPSDNESGQYVYESRRGDNSGHHRVVFRVEAELGASKAGTLEHFLLERYLLFVQRSEKIYVGQVHHAPYQAFNATVDELVDQLVESAGLPAVNQPPELVHWSPGVEVEVFGIRQAGD